MRVESADGQGLGTGRDWSGAIFRSNHGTLKRGKLVGRCSRGRDRTWRQDHGNRTPEMDCESAKNGVREMYSNDRDTVRLYLPRPSKGVWCSKYNQKQPPKHYTEDSTLKNNSILYYYFQGSLRFFLYYCCFRSVIFLNLWEKRGKQSTLIVKYSLLW